MGVCTTAKKYHVLFDIKILLEGTLGSTSSTQALLLIIQDCSTPELNSFCSLQMLHASKLHDFQPSNF